MRRRGFTIVEIACVLAVMGIVVAITVPAMDVLVRRARTEEARVMLASIAHAELRHFRDTGAYLACSSPGEVPRHPVRFSSDVPCWKALAIQLEGDVRYRYRVELADGSFVAIAEGDLNGNGVSSEFRWEGRTQRVVEKEPLE